MTEAEIFEYCRTTVRRYLRKGLPNQADLDDCVSEVVVRALESLRKGTEPLVLEAWLNGIAANVLKERYRAKNRESELPAEFEREPGDPQLELARTDLPELPSEYEILLGKQQLWDTLDAATLGIGAGLAAVMRTHMRLTFERGRHVVGAELAAELGQPVEIVNRQLQRSRVKMFDAVAALVLARTGRGDCAGLRDVLAAEQLTGGRRLVLGPEQTRAVLKHAAGCAVCATRADEARDYSRWALGPGLLRLGEDDEERRRALVALLDRAGEGGLSPAQAPAAAALVVPVPLAGPRLLTSRPSLLRKVDAVTRFVRDNPEVAHRIVAGAAGGVAVAATIVAALLAPGGEHDSASPRPGTTTAPGAPAPVRSPGAIPAAVTVPRTPAPPPETPPAPASSAPRTATAPGSPAAPPPAAPATTASATTAPVPPPAPSSSAPAATPPPTTAAPTTAPPTTAPPTTAPPTTAPPTTAPPTTAPPTTAPPTTSTPPSTPAPRPQAITIDATDVSYTTFTISRVGVRDSRQRQQLDLTPGAYTLATPAGQVLNFSVTADYRVQYDPALDGTLSGRDSSVLAVHGHAVTFDVTGVDYYNMAISGTGFPVPQPVRQLKLLPGAHNVVTANGNSLPFTVTAEGKVAYAADPRGLLSGAGSGTLAVHGLPVTLDSSDTDYAGMTISGAGWPAPQAVRTFRLLPGTHSAVTANGNSLPFTIAADGTVTYADGLAGPFTGAGGKTLSVHGFRVTLDTTGVDYDNMTVSGTGWRPPQAVREYRLLPGGHRVVAHDGLTVPFTVTAAGLVRPDHPLLTGTGTVLAVHGLPVTLDATDVDYANVTIEGVAFGTPRPPRTVRIFPGTHRVVTNGGLTVSFTVDDRGFVGYEPGREGLLTGQGSSTLAVHGFRIGIDVSDVDYQNVTVNGLPDPNPGARATVRLLPGATYLVLTGGLTVPFAVTAEGRVQYDPGLRGTFTGEGGTSLALHGFPITVDASASGYPQFGVGGVGWWDARQARVLRLVPGSHYVSIPGGDRLLFQLTSTGHVGYDATVDGAFAGRDGTTLILRPRG
ncbi:sigma factor [Amycolatopsis sp. cg9]|uniref:sigma factor n=1 Tax=Amycolatopsis sp. cg9 TaxID=3238801 RepID=UPI0035245A46